MESSSNQNNNIQLSLVISVNDVLKDAQRINVFRGDNTFALTSFLREVDTILGLVQNDAGAREYIYKRVVLNKLQGEALHVLRSLGPNPVWSETKKALIQNFGVKESYHQLYQEAFGAKNHGISNYYSLLLSILCKINEKYEYDPDKPSEFSPENSEKIILRTFLNNIDVNLASVVINRNVSKLRDAYNLLEQQGLIRNNVHKTFNNNQIVKHPNFNQNIAQNSNYNNQTRSNNFRNTRSGVSNSNQSRNLQSNVNSYYTPNFSNRNQHFQSNFQNFSNRHNNNNNQNFSNQTRNSNSQYNSQYNNNRSKYGHSDPVEMEIDHLDAVVHCPEEGEDHVNFHLIASKRHFQ